MAAIFGLLNVRVWPYDTIRPHCALLLIQNRTPLIKLQLRLEHSATETTANLYAHLEYETKINSAETLKKLSRRAPASRVIQCASIPDLTILSQ